APALCLVLGWHPPDTRLPASPRMGYRYARSTRAGCGHDAAGRPATDYLAPGSARTAHRTVGGHTRMRYVFGDCTLDTELYVVQRTGLTIPLRLKVFQVLHYLLGHRDRVVSKQELQEQVWPDHFVSDAALEGV